MLERFPKAPITEALIDLRVEISDRISVSQLEGLHTAIKEAYPDKKARRRWEQRLEFKEGKEPVSTGAKDLGVDGYLFWAADEKQVVPIGRIHLQSAKALLRLEPDFRGGCQSLECLCGWGKARSRDTLSPAFHKRDRNSFEDF